MQVYASNACQIIPPADAAIAAAIEAELPLWALPPLDEVACYRHPLVRDPLPGLADRYYSALKQHLHHRSTEANAAAPAMAYTALHGVGTPWLLRAFSEWGLPPPILTPRQCEPDPDFSTGVRGRLRCSVQGQVVKTPPVSISCTCMQSATSAQPLPQLTHSRTPAVVSFPNPEEGKGAWQLAFLAAEAAGACLAIANDPDADRFAVAERDDVTGEPETYCSVGGGAASLHQHGGRRCCAECMCQLLQSPRVPNSVPRPLPHVPAGAWRTFTGNEIGAMLAVWVLRNYRARQQQQQQQGRSSTEKLAVLSSTVSSRMLAAIAAQEGAHWAETLTGFKASGALFVDMLRGWPH